ncbi:hypothetical protein [Microbulbifer sp. HZ11]|uniref:hypothetical protein n=1 Tax=unclassified Microbulbifer TaxID=2619833 RepID=UPI0012DFB9EE|nr:hypothetical protein [Microbulbifer sp. HZ11]
MAILKIHGRRTPIAREASANLLAKDFPATPESSVDIDSTPGNRQESERTTLQGERFRAAYFAAGTYVATPDINRREEIEPDKFRPRWKLAGQEQHEMEVVQS